MMTPKFYLTTLKGVTGSQTRHKNACLRILHHFLPESLQQYLLAPYISKTIHKTLGGVNRVDNSPYTDVNRNQAHVVNLRYTVRIGVGKEA